MKNQVFRNFIDTTREELKPKAFQVTGFDFIEDKRDVPPLYSEEQSKEHGFWHPKQPRPNGFLYVTAEYRAHVEGVNNEH